MDVILLSIIIAATVFLLISQIVRIELTAVMLIVALSGSGILTASEALSGLSNPATITIAAMLMLSAGLARTGALDYLARAVDRLHIRSINFLLLAGGALTAFASAFLNNTVVVIIMIPVLLRVCQKNDILPSKVMIPLSYFAILGGTLTLIGTSTNILVSGIYEQAGGPGFTMFEFTPMGLCYLVLGGVFLFLFADQILPERKVLSQVLEEQHRTHYVTEITVRGESPFVGAALKALLEGFSEVKVLELVRDEDVFLWPEMNMQIEVGDMLLIEGSPQAIHRMLEKQGIDLASAIADDERVKISRIDLLVVEAVITPNSTFFNQRLPDIGLNRHYGVKVLGIQRMGRHVQVRLREMKLQVGDMLLIQGERASLQELENTGDVLLIERVEKTLRNSSKAPLAVGIFLAVVLAASTTRLPLSMLTMAGVAAMMLFRCLRIREALQSLESSILLLIASAIPLGIAMEKTGMADTIARSILAVASDYGPVAILSALYLVTSILTAFLTNAATAALLAPIVLRIAADAGVDPKPLLIAVTFGASASFFTPIGYQTNLLVMGPGGYRFRDYLKIGLMLTVLMWLAATFMIPVFWPLQ